MLHLYFWNYSTATKPIALKFGGSKECRSPSLNVQFLSENVCPRCFNWTFNFWCNMSWWMTVYCLKTGKYDTQQIEPGHVASSESTLASFQSRGLDSTQFGSRNFQAILIFPVKSSAINWIDGKSFDPKVLYCSWYCLRCFSLGLNLQGLAKK